MLTVRAFRNQTIPLGAVGEHDVRRVEFDLKDWERELGEGSVSILRRRPGESVAYPTIATKEGNYWYWAIGLDDTAFAGNGEAEVVYTPADGGLAKSEIFQTSIRESLTASNSDIPAAQQGWVDTVLAAAASVENAVVHAPIVGDNGNWHVWNREEDAYVDVGVYAGGTAPYIGTNGNGYVAGEDTGVDATGPRGIPGEKGDPGLVWEDVWDSSAVYNAGEVVHHNGSAWVCVGDEVAEGVEPGTDTESWALLVAKGDDGDQLPIWTELDERIAALEQGSSQNATVYIGPDQPTDGTVYWLDTSEDEADAGDNSGDSGDTDDSGDNTEPVTYTITNTLTNVTNSNAASSVEENASYTATLSAADGYEISTVKVTMGGTDVTSTVYADGVVNISAVTGDVGITATATAVSTESDVDLSETNAFASVVTSSDKASISFGASTSPTWDDFMALDVEKLYFYFIPADQYKKIIKIKASYNSGYGSEVIATNITVAQATDGTYDFVTNAWDKYSESGYMVFEIDVAALQATVQALYDAGTLDSTKAKFLYIETVNSVSAGSTAYLLYNYNG